MVVRGDRFGRRGQTHWTRWASVLVAAALAVGCSGTAVRSATSDQSAAVVASPVFPTTEWQRIDRPESVGWSTAGLEQVRAKLSMLPTTGFMAVVGGRVLMDYGNVQTVSYLASVRKSVLSMLYGIYRERGKIDLDKTLEELRIDDIGGLSAEEKQATVRDLIRARSGVFHAASNPGDDLASAPARGSQKHGTYYLYSNWDFNALGTIFEQETGVNIYDALEREIAQPIGMQDFNRATHQKSGNLSVSMHPAYHINLSTRDMARVGYLMLRNGNWNGRQIVPAPWVKESTSVQTPRSEMNPARHRNGAFGYGYLWWVFDNPILPKDYEGAYTGLGAIGQQILIMPKLDLVVVHKTAPNEANRSVSHEQFLGVVQLLVTAHCGTACQR